MYRFLTIATVVLLAVASDASAFGRRCGGGLFHRGHHTATTCNSCQPATAYNYVPQTTTYQPTQTLQHPTQYVPTVNVGGGCFGGVCRP